MKLGYRLYICVSYYFELSSSNTCISQNESYQESPVKTKNYGGHEKRDNVNT